MPRARKSTSVRDLPSTGYGDTAALERSVASVPMAGAGEDASGAAPFISPDEVPNLSDPSARPNEPVTAGLRSGPGVGPEALHGMTATDPTRQALQAMLLVDQNPDIMRLIDLLDLQGR